MQPRPPTAGAAVARRRGTMAVAWVTIALVFAWGVAGYASWSGVWASTPLTVVPTAPSAVRFGTPAPDRVPLPSEGGAGSAPSGDEEAAQLEAVRGVSVTSRPLLVVRSVVELDGNRRVQVLAPEPVVRPHQPRGVAEALAYYSGPDRRPFEERDNSVPVSQEDFERARNSKVLPLAEARVPDRGGKPADRVRAGLFNLLRNFIVAGPDEANPFIVDYGDSLGPHLAELHTAATVVVVTPDPTSAPSKGVRNAYVLRSQGPTDAVFEPWYRACHFASLTLVLGRMLEPEAVEGDWAATQLLKALPTARMVIAALTPSELKMVEPHARGTSVDGAHVREWRDTVEGMRLEIKNLALIKGGVDEIRLILVRITVLESARACAKTWGGPLVQWDRKLIASVKGSQVSFAVRSVIDDKAGARLGRTIHPLQFIPSVNMDTLLGAGLSSAQRLRLLSQMMATPRYSDPLPHNWVVGLGGRAIRIDKVDRRYDEDVDEGKGYWGTSTRGYLHLLGHHLCLPIGSNGVPEALSAAESASLSGAGCKAAECTRCWRCCGGAYLPKGSQPCTACLACAQCVGSLAVSQPTDLTDTTRARCQQTYPSMHRARKVWGKWKKADDAFDATNAAAVSAAADLCLL
jgi:hypothetical protein